MNNKISPVMIIVLILIVVAIVIFAVAILGGSGSNNISLVKEQEEISSKPIVELNLNSEKEDLDSVTINVSATINDEQGIKSIILPDGTEIYSDSTTYDVKKNGIYTFKVTGINNETTIQSIEVKNIKVFSSENPYIPDGFSHVSGEVDTGFVIEDSYGNQYVWVPVESGKLIRNTNSNNDYEENDSTALGLVNSVAQNYGFYIGRYEVSEYELNEEKVSASMEGKIPLTNITYLDAVELINNSAKEYDYKNCNIAMLNSYAWDTTLEWINLTQKNYSSSTNFGNYSGTIYPTGQTESDIVNNICDMAGNVREWTTEIYNGASATSQDGNKEEKVYYRVVRGGSTNLNRTAASHIGYPENTSDTYWGFRMILYK